MREDREAKGVTTRGQQKMKAPAAESGFCRIRG